MDVVRIAIPRYLLYFDVCVELHGGKYFVADYSKSTAIAFTATETISNWPSQLP
jgi:ACR3 family arsenite transporter